MPRRPPKNLPPFSARLRKLRARAGLSRPALASLAGVSPQAVAAYEVGSREPGLAALALLADALAVSLDVLAGRVAIPAERNRE